MESGSLRERYLDELGDRYDAEGQAISLLPQLRDAACAPSLRDALAMHFEEARLLQATLDEEGRAEGRLADGRGAWRR